MRLRDEATGKLLQAFSVHAIDVNDVSRCKDDKLATSSSDRTIELWLLPQ
jgi:WD40 repeat protein